MKELNKTKLIVVIIMSLAVIALISLVIILTNKNNEEKATKILTDSEFETLKVSNIEISYSEDGTSTNLNFQIDNETNENIENQTIDIQLTDENDGLISQTQVKISRISANSNYPIVITLGGKIEEIKKIKILQPEETNEAEE